MDEDQLQEPSSICSSMLQEDAVIKKDSVNDTTKHGDTCTSVLPEDCCLPVASKHLLGSKSKQKPYLGGLPPAYLLPYLVLIKNCVHLPFSTIRKRCLTGEILCRIDSLMLRRKKKKPPLEPAKEQTLQETKYATFDGLEDLQWKLFKGLLKRKPKTVGLWRKANYSKGPVTTLIPEAKEYILPLLPKDWIIDESLAFSKEMVFFLLQTN
ncbi:uncharacterized protein LOC103066132 [Python bivittatus]|uniref:Uncharacterized protein LOC103066132 n=1 Tax=Python bivittatus TaxID=176946 RepID=A0A9F2QWU6_PYTBI|nr:uncharacterized protein LOC103066132 [Python bivittatus]XP_025023069.1 uncharacterized protein LOC103066132 [Python bivittatus]XP_025023070.1 uncharacterized protein LOC103066132 [Python bivittatus]XP_025023072.1 uncharacterized protein LOC103066132 [Python bivittatus]XP_025023073.1 uncharacterized protein LOC103066132 [Python bivittatus]XP_025023074.1 uncharacterized protein LOC103066132 [Python bivittatus]XP_025023075.1 uncharacterized protein LOC103066132 [Python bivittatus]